MPPYGTPLTPYQQRRLQQSSEMQARPAHVPLVRKNKKGGAFLAKPILHDKNSPARKNKPKNNVNWGVVTIREHDIGLGCSPCCEAPLTILETHTQYPPQAMNAFENVRRDERRHRKQLRIPLVQRRILLSQSGVSPDEIHFSNLEMLPIRQKILSALRDYKGFRNRPPEYLARELAKEILSEEEFSQYTHFPEGPSTSARSYRGNFNTPRSTWNENPTASNNYTNSGPKKTPIQTNSSNNITTKGADSLRQASLKKTAPSNAGSLSNIGKVKKKSYKSSSSVPSSFSTSLSSGVMKVAIAGAASNNQPKRVIKVANQDVILSDDEFEC